MRTGFASVAAFVLALNGVACGADAGPPEGSSEQSAFEASDVKLAVLYGALLVKDGTRPEALTVIVECPTVADSTAKVSAAGLYKLRIPSPVDGKSAGCALHVSDGTRSGTPFPVTGYQEPTRYDFAVDGTLALKRQ